MKQCVTSSRRKQEKASKHIAILQYISYLDAYLDRLEEVHLPTSHQVANRREHPRILILDDAWGFAARVNREANLPGHVEVVSSLASVAQDEWDALILRGEYQDVNTWNAFDGPTYSRVDDHLYIFKVLPDGRHGNFGFLDRVRGLNTSDDPVDLHLSWEVPGREISIKQGLDRELRESLIEVADNRSGQSGLSNPKDVPVGVELDAFAVGPKGVVLAGVLAVPKRGEVWFVPDEVKTFGPWLNAAFASWRRRDAKKFPGVPDWWASTEWYSVEETSVAQRIADETATFEKAKAEYESAISALELEMEDARNRASAGSRQLLRGQDDLLQDAVRDALTKLGFAVRDMDLEWADRERREDFRITDPNDPEWMVLGDATGVTGNAKGGKIVVLQGYVTKYLHEESPKKIPGMWYLLNREIEKDPAVRSTILRADEIEPFASQQGLILDTTALFVLLRYAQTWPSEKQAIRRYLRDSFGLVSLPEALNWVDARQSVAASTGSDLA